MFGRLVAGMIVIALAFGVWALWPDRDSDDVTTSTPSTTTTTSAATTSTTTLVSTTTTAGTEVIATVAQAEELLRELWFGWFEGIYEQDEARIRQVVASQSMLDNASAQFGVMTFDGQPDSQSLSFVNTEILNKGGVCTVVWSEVDVAFRGGVAAGVHVLRSTAEGWKFVSVWANKNDLWEQDCTAELEPLP